MVLVDKDFVTKKEAVTKVFIEDMTKLMNDPETADFTLKVGNKSFEVHKAVLGARSEVFRTMFLSNLREEGGGRRKMQFITTSARNVFVNIVQIFKSNIIVSF